MKSMNNVLMVSLVLGLSLSSADAMETRLQAKKKFAAQYGLTPSQLKTTHNAPVENVEGRDVSGHNLRNSGQKPARYYEALNNELFPQAAPQVEPEHRLVVYGERALVDCNGERQLALYNPAQPTDYVALAKTAAGYIGSAAVTTGAAVLAVLGAGNLGYVASVDQIRVILAGGLAAGIAAKAAYDQINK